MKQKIALIGCGHIHTPNFVRIMKGREDIEVTAVWDHDAERARKNAAELNAPAVPVPEKVWNDPSIGGVVICSETNLHKELGLAADRWDFPPPMHRRWPPR